MPLISQIIGNKGHYVEDDPHSKPFPAIPNDLLQALNVAFPLALPNSSDPERDIWIMVGRRQVVEYLLQRKEQELDEHV